MAPWALVVCDMWNLTGPRVRPVSPALAGGFLSTVSSGKSSLLKEKRVFIYLTALSLSCGTQDLLVAAYAIFSCGMQNLSHGMWDLIP